MYSLKVSYRDFLITGGCAQLGFERGVSATKLPIALLRQVLDLFLRSMRLISSCPCTHSNT
jgi:hypothetical protein